MLPEMTSKAGNPKNKVMTSGLVICVCVITPITYLFYNKGNVSIITESDIQTQLADVVNISCHNISHNGSTVVHHTAPSSSYEYFRRRFGMNLEQLMHYTRAQLDDLKKMAKQGQNVAGKIDKMKAFLMEQHSYLVNEWKNMTLSDGYEEWRKAESKQLTTLVQERLYYLQNPPNCAKAKKLVCRPEQSCGYGCHVHHLGFCLMVAYGVQRTLILDTKHWKYTNEGWEKFFRPISNTCVDTGGHRIEEWNEANLSEAPVIHLPIAGSVRRSYPPYVAVPSDIFDRLNRLHGNPLAWWTGQAVAYLQRPNKELEKHIEQTAARIGYQHPIVGVHVRRTDKNEEAKYFNLDEYMIHVEEYYRRLKITHEVPVKRVFIATDERNVLEEAKKKYRDYVFIDNENSGPEERYSTQSLQRIITNIHFLSRSDYMVCTLSSNVCRLAYEMMQTLHVDASAYLQSLDFYFQYQGVVTGRLVDVAVYDHKPPREGEIKLRKGDKIRPSNKGYNGYTTGTNDNTKQVGLYPSYKVDFSTYPEDMPLYPDSRGFPTNL